MNRVRFFAVAIAAFGMSAACLGQAVPEKHRLTPEQVRERRAKMMMKRYGGILRKSGSAHGKVVFLNAQKKVGRDGLQRALDVIEERIHPIWEWKEAGGPVNAHNPTGALKSAGADIGVVLVEDAEAAGLVTAPECGWAVVNVAALSDGCDAETLAKRVRIEVLRAFALIGGAAFMQRDQIVMRPDIMTARDLDMIKEENYGIDVAYAISEGLPKRGVTPWLEVTYKKACQEGWAPPPTNDVQKAIWDKAHAIPKAPMKIEFDPKKGR